MAESEASENVVRIELVQHLDGNYDLDINAPEINIEYALSIIERAKRLLENHLELLLAQQKIAQARGDIHNEARTRKILSNLKM
jgi:hypothetical protein